MGSYTSIHLHIHPYITFYINILPYTVIYIHMGSFNLRSSNECLLNIPKKITKKTLGDPSFQVAVPRLWNKLPATLRTIDCPHDAIEKPKFLNKILVFMSYSYIFRFISL